MNHICEMIRPEVEEEIVSASDPDPNPFDRGRLTFIEAMDQGINIAPPPHILARNPTFNINQIFNSIQPTV